jgi:hypothetical protein
VLEVVGSVEDPALVDGWSVLDLRVRLPEPVGLTVLLDGDAVWAVEATDSDEGQVVRAVLADGCGVSTAARTTVQPHPDRTRRRPLVLGRSRRGDQPGRRGSLPDPVRRGSGEGLMATFVPF